MMRKLLLFLTLLCISTSMQALDVYSRSGQYVGSDANAEANYGIYVWTGAGDVAAFLSGSYSGSVAGNCGDKDAALAAIKSAKFIKMGKSNEPLNQADIAAIFSYFTNAEYIRMDNCVISGDVDFSSMTIGSSSLKEVTLPAGATKEQIVAANTVLKAASSDFKLVVGITGREVTTTNRSYTYELDGKTFTYTGDDAEDGKTITLSDEPIYSALTLVSGYPKYSYTNTRYNNKTCYASESEAKFEDINGTKYLVPNPLPVLLTPSTKYYVMLNGVKTQITGYSDADLANYISYDSENDKYYVAEDYKIWVNNEHQSKGTEVIKEANGFTYVRRDWQGTSTASYDGEYTIDEDGNYVGYADNTYTGQFGDYFSYTPAYKYTYTDKDGNTQEVTYTEANKDGVIQVGTYSGEVTLKEVTTTTTSIVPDGATAYVNEAGTLKDALQMFTTNDNNPLASYKSAETITILGELNNTDLASLSNFDQPKLIDMSDAEFTESGAGAKIADAINGKNLAAANKPVVIIPTPDGSDDPITGSTDEVALQTGTITYAYWIDEDKTQMNAWCPNQALVLANLQPVVTNSMALTFLPDYKADGTFSQYMLMYANSSSASGNLTSADVLGNLPFLSVDLTWVFYGDVFCNYANLNEETHYIIVPANSTETKYDFTADNGSSSYKYNDNIWVVATYKGAAEPYATKVYYDGRELNTAPYASDNLKGFEANGTTANITYIRKAGTLSGAAGIVSDLQKNAERTVIVGKVASSDIEAVNIMRNSVLDLSGAVLQDGADLSSLENEYIKYLALPYDSEEDVASFKQSQCTNLLGVGKFVNTAEDANHLYLQSYQEGGMVTIMSCLEKAKGIEYITAAGEMNARDLSANTNCYDDNGHFTFTYGTTTIDNVVGGSVTLTTGLAKINEASIEGALSGHIASYFKGADFTGVTLKQYAAEPENGQAKMYDYDNTYQDDLHFASLGYMTGSSNDSFEYLKLPTDASVWRLPTQSLNNGLYNLHDLCIPGQYREIGAFVVNNDNSLFRVTTTNVTNGNGTDTIYEEYEGSLTGNPGGNTITLPPSLVLLEAGAFGNVEHFTDVYVTSAEVPVCEKDAFGSGTYYGWGGFNDAHDGTAQRTDYGNESDDESAKAFGVLHWTGNFTLDEIKKFTDIERVYSLRDRIGKTDDRGNVLTWPTLSEIQRAFALACTGYLDGAWMPYANGATEPEYDTNGVLSNLYTAEGNSTTQEQGDSHYTDYGSPVGETFTEYIGWHQFVLVGSWSNAEKFEYKPWDTMAIPYNVTFDKLKDLYAVTKSVSKTNKKIIVDSEGFPIANAADGVDGNGEVATDAETLLPTVSTLTSVNRKITYKKDKNGSYVLNESTGIYEHKTAEQLKSVDASKRYAVQKGLITLQFTEGMVPKAEADGKVYNWKIKDDYTWNVNSKSSDVGEWEENADGIIMKAGYPYHLKVFVPLGTEDIHTYAINELKAAGVEATAESPYDEWVVPTTGNAGGDDLKYKFRGYYEENAPQMNSYFLWIPKSGESLWYRYAESWGDDWGANHPSEAYTALIGLIEKGSFPASDLLLTDKTNGATAKASFEIGFVEDEYETTGIREIGNDGEAYSMPTGRVYNINGQVVNENGSLNGLDKGLYIINGKKYIVK